MPPVLGFLASGFVGTEAILRGFIFRYLSGVIEIMGLNDLYGFVDPQLTHEGNKFDDTEAYVTKCFQRRKEIYFVHYVAG